MKFYFLLFTLFFGIHVTAQTAHDLEIYAEDGTPFQLISNGRVINEDFAANVKLEDIHDDYLHVKIVFKDDAIAPVEKKYLQLAEPGTGAKAPVSVVYKLVEKKGQYKLRFASRSPKKIQPDVIIIGR